MKGAKEKNERWKVDHIWIIKKNNPPVAPYILYVDEKNEELIEKKPIAYLKIQLKKEKSSFW